MNAKQRTAANHVVISVKRKEFQRGCNVGKFLNFIKENKLGKVLPYTVQSGYGRYAVVAFDLDKLKDFDPKGVTEFKAAHGIPEKEPVKRKQKNREIER